MTYLDIILISLGLAMDCFAVSIANGIMYSSRCTWKNTFRMAFSFGLFQALMPLVGYAFGIGFETIIYKYAPIIALVILGGLGLKMILLSFSKEGDKPKRSPLNSFASLVVYSIATSIDALASGLVFISYNKYNIAFAVAMIGLFSFILTLLGIILGKTYGNKFKVNVEFLGGLILIAIGLKIYLCS